jgi:hypothetical protein
MTMDSAARRVELVEKMNGVAANIVSNKERVRLATEALAAADDALKAKRREYTVLYKSVKSDAVDAEARLVIANQINEVLEVINGLAKALNKAKSEDGTARGELQKARDEQARLDSMLDKHLPTELLLDDGSLA